MSQVVPADLPEPAGTSRARDMTRPQLAAEPARGSDFCDVRNGRYVSGDSDARLNSWRRRLGGTTGLRLAAGVCWGSSFAPQAAAARAGRASGPDELAGASRGVVRHWREPRVEREIPLPRPDRSPRSSVSGVRTRATHRDSGQRMAPRTRGRGWARRGCSRSAAAPVSSACGALVDRRSESGSRDAHAAAAARTRLRPSRSRCRSPASGEWTSSSTDGSSSSATAEPHHAGWEAQKRDRAATWRPRAPATRRSGRSPRTSSTTGSRSPRRMTADPGAPILRHLVQNSSDRSRFAERPVANALTLGGPEIGGVLRTAGSGVEPTARSPRRSAR